MTSERGVLIGTVAIAAAVVAIVVALGGSPEPTPSRAAHDDEMRERSGIRGGGGSLSSGSSGAARSGAAPREMPGELARDLAQRLVGALDGGVPRGPADIPPPDSIAPGHSAALVPPSPQVRLDHPLTATEQLEYAARLYDYLVLRRDDLRHQLADMEQSGQGQSDPATRIRRELTRLDSAEPNARHRVDEIAARARAEAPPPSEPSEPSEAEPEPGP